MKEQLRIKNTTLCAILSSVITFVTALMIISEWYYKENRLSPMVFKLFSVVAIIIYGFFYSNLIINIFNSKRNKRRDTPIKVILIMYFICQSFFTITVFLS